jgi:hypothetical protein
MSDDNIAFHEKSEILRKRLGLRTMRILFEYLVDAGLADTNPVPVARPSRKERGSGTHTAVRVNHRLKVKVMHDRLARLWGLNRDETFARLVTTAPDTHAPVARVAAHLAENGHEPRTTLAFPLPRANYLAWREYAGHPGRGHPGHVYYERMVITAYIAAGLDDG